MVRLNARLGQEDQSLLGRVVRVLFCLLLLTWPLHAAEIGAKVPEFRLSDASGKSHSPGDYAGKTVVLSFWSFKCPVSLAYDERLKALQGKYRDRGVVVLAVASNANESETEIQRNAANLNLSLPVLLDQDGSLAATLAASHTPGLFIIDQSGILRYRGAMDNNKSPGEKGRVSYVEDALDTLLAGRPVATPETRVFGCSIRRK